MTKQIQDALVAEVSMAMAEVSVRLDDARPETFSLFDELAPHLQAQLARDAWMIGLRAIGNAHAAAQESRLKDIGSTLLGEMERQLHSHVELAQKTIGEALRRYFDPTDGQVTQRLAAFAADGGALAQLLAKHLGPQNSVLSETLTRQFGEASPLLKSLSPTESNGVIKQIEAQLRGVIADNQQAMVRALDPLVEDSAVARFLRSLRDDLQGANANQREQLAAALAALDANNEGSLISRLVRETNLARQDVLAAVNPDAPGSPLAALKHTMTQLLQEQSAAQAASAQQQAERQAAFEKDVREVITRLDTRRQENARSVRGGLEFEDTVHDFVKNLVVGAPCVFDAVGATAGVGRSKKGDSVLTFTAESAFAGAAVVFEAKREVGYGVQDALAELEQARKNRGACAGVFVMAKSHARDGFPLFARYGNDVLVTWDEQDPGSAAYLHAAVLVGMSLAGRMRKTGEPGNIKALASIESDLNGEIARLEKMEKSTETIRRGADGIAEEIRKGKKAINTLISQARLTLTALNVELVDEVAERGSPVTAGNAQLVSALAAQARDVVEQEVIELPMAEGSGPIKNSDQIATERQ